MSPTMAKEIDRQLEELEAENERLKYALKQRTAQSDANANLWMKELRTGAKQEKEIEHLRKENAKLKCLALHLFWKYAERLMWKCDGMSKLSTTPYTKDFYLRKCLRWEDVRNKYHKAYRKAKKALREGCNA